MNKPVKHKKMKLQKRKTDKGTITILKNHIRNQSGGKKAYGKNSTVCVSSVLSYFGITPDQYRHSWNWKAKDPRVYFQILRRHGWGVGNRKKQFRNCKTVNQLIDSMEYFIDPINRNRADRVTVHYIITVPGHVFVMDSTGKVCIDTAPTWSKGDKRQIRNVHAVYNMEGRKGN